MLLGAHGSLVVMVQLRILIMAVKQSYTIDKTVRTHTQGPL